MKVFTVATRAGELAVTQTRMVISALERIYPDIQFRIKKITTRGDADRRTTLWKLKDSGFFTSMIEDALLAGDADFAVHSYKDLPTAPREGLTIPAVFKRKFPEDCLLAAVPVDSIDHLPPSAVTGTSSLRRCAQLTRLRSDLQARPIRGNVTTRIKLLEEGKFDAIILARAGLERLGLGEKITFNFDPRRFIPAPAQGALAVQARDDDSQITRILAAIDDPQTRLLTAAERQILVTTKCGCHAPVGAFAQIQENDILIDAFISGPQGGRFIKRDIKGPAGEALELAEKLANELLEAGGSEILKDLERRH